MSSEWGIGRSTYLFYLYSEHESEQSHIHIETPDQ